MHCKHLECNISVMIRQKKFKCNILNCVLLAGVFENVMYVHVIPFNYCIQVNIVDSFVLAPFTCIVIGQSEDWLNFSFY